MISIKLVGKFRRKKANKANGRIARLIEVSQEINKFEWKDGKDFVMFENVTSIVILSNDNNRGSEVA